MTSSTKASSRTVVPVRLVRQAADLLMKHADGQPTSEREVRGVIDKLRASCDEDSILEADEIRPEIAVVRVAVLVRPDFFDDTDPQKQFGVDWSLDVPNDC